MLSLLDETILDGIRERVGHLVDDVVGIDEADNAGLLGCPKVLPATTERVLTLGEELVEKFEESGVVAMGVLDTGVMVVAHGHREQDTHAGALGSERETVDKSVV